MRRQKKNVEIAAKLNCLLNRFLLALLLFGSGWAYMVVLSIIWRLVLRCSYVFVLICIFPCTKNYVVHVQRWHRVHNWVSLNLSASLYPYASSSIFVDGGHPTRNKYNENELHIRFYLLLFIYEQLWAGFCFKITKQQPKIWKMYCNRKIYKIFQCA